MEEWDSAVLDCTMRARLTVLSPAFALAAGVRALLSIVINDTTPGAYWLLSVTWHVGKIISAWYALDR